jgi:hypothetical protein
MPHTLVFIFPSLLCLQKCIEDIFAGFYTTEHIVTGSNPFEKFHICVIFAAMVWNICQIHPHWFKGFVGLKKCISESIK